MAAANILAIGSTAATAEVTVGSGEVKTVALKVPGGGSIGGAVRVGLALKDDLGGYLPMGELTSTDPARVLQAPGTYQVSRIAGQNVGVFSG